MADQLPLHRDNWDTPHPDDPALAHIVPELRPLAVPIDKLEHLPDNAHHGDPQALGRNLARFQQRKPIVVNATTHHVEAGNTTLTATHQAGHQWIAAVLVTDDPTTERAYALADNRAHQLGWDDTAQLANDLIHLWQAENDPLLDAIGYDGDDLDQLITDLGINLNNPDQPITNTDPIRPQPTIRESRVEPEHEPDHDDTPGDPQPPPHTAANPPHWDPTRPATLNLTLPHNLRHPLTTRLKQLQNETATTTMGEALAHHFNLHPAD